MEVWGNGSQEREFLFVEDAADGIIQAALHSDVDVLNLATDKIGGFEWSAVQTANGVALLSSNLNTSAHIITAAEMLAAHSDYEILMHKKWVQNAEAKSTSKLLQIASGPQADTQLDGAIRFYVSRFFHLDVDIGLKDLNVAFPATDDSGEAAQVYQILEDRRIKTEDINYFDHPKFGVLVQVNAVKTGRK